MRSTIILIFGLLVAANNGIADAPPLTIEPSVIVTFGAFSNRLYQVERATTLAPDAWLPVGRSHIGHPFRPVREAIPASVAMNQFFRTREYSWSQMLAAYFPLDGSAVDASLKGNFISVLAYTADRFESPNAAGLTSNTVEGRYSVRAAVERFAQSTNDFSISLWVSGHRVFGPPDRMFVSTNRLALLRNRTNALELYVGANSAPLAVSNPLAWTAEEWRCFHVVRASNVFRVYRDADLVAEGESTIAYDESAWIFTFGPTSGGVDEVRLYNRALPPDEVGAISRITRDDPSIPISPVHQSVGL